MHIYGSNQTEITQKAGGNILTVMMTRCSRAIAVLAECPFTSEGQMNCHSNALNCSSTAFLHPPQAKKNK